MRMFCGAYVATDAVLKHTRYPSPLAIFLHQLFCDDFPAGEAFQGSPGGCGLHKLLLD